MPEYKNRNFALREDILGGDDPGRTFLEVGTIGNIVLCGLADASLFEAHR